MSVNTFLACTALWAHFGVSKNVEISSIYFLFVFAQSAAVPFIKSLWTKRQRLAGRHCSQQTEGGLHNSQARQRSVSACQQRHIEIRNCLLLSLPPAPDSLII